MKLMKNARLENRANVDFIHCPTLLVLQFETTRYILERQYFNTWSLIYNSKNNIVGTTFQCRRWRDSARSVLLLLLSKKYPPVHLGRHPVSRLRRGRTRNFHRRLSLLSYRLKVKHGPALHVSSLLFHSQWTVFREDTRCMVDYRVRVAPSRVKSQYEKLIRKYELVILIFGV